MGRLDGKVALVSGGARGIGSTITKLFASEGAKVVLGDVLDDEGRQVEAVARELGGDVTFVHLDVTHEDDWRRAVETAENRYGKLDILINNAGIHEYYSIEEMPLEVWNGIMEVNSTGVFLGTKHAIPALRKAGRGSIVNLSSIAGTVARKIISPAYSASKGSVRLLSKVTAIQHAEDGIRCNSVHPGPVDTPMQADLTGKRASREERVAEVPLGRLGVPEDVAYAVLYLASDEASFVTGTELVIDGGITAQ